MLSLLRHELFSRWGAVLGWGIGLGLYGVMYVAIYPEIGEQMSALADISIYQAMGIDVSSFEGYMASSLVGIMPIMLAIYVIMTSSATLAGEDDKGTLELIVTMPLKRWQIVTMKATALVVVTFSILVIAGLWSAFALGLMKRSFEVDVTETQFFLAILSGWPITLAFLMIGLFFSASLPNHLTASMATTIVFLLSYFGNILAGSVESLSAIQPFPLFYYFDTSAELFSKGVQARDVSILLGVAVFFFVLALLSFERRDITVGQWPWQRAKTRHTPT